jgi:uncharacterized integral membrane protein (TIGR00698 family)
VLVALAVVSASPWGRADLSLLVGVAVALLGLEAPAWRAPASRWLIQASVVLLGLRLDLHALVRAAGDGLALALGTIAGTLVAGLLLGRLLRCGRDETLLVSCGTAICGASAIAAVGGAIGASASTLAVATGAVFILNAVGLWSLPWVGHALDLTDHQFGLWAGVALHDIASVGGAARLFGPDSTDVATVVKMSRVVWVAPLALIAGGVWPGHARGAGSRGVPWFVLLFLGASALRTALPSLREHEGAVRAIAGAGFQGALLLIGAGVSWQALRALGWRTLAHAGILWVLVAAASLVAVRTLA